MTTKKNHARAADKIQLSIAIPRSLVMDLQKIAAHENRNRNQMIGILLREAANKRIKKIIDEQGSGGADKAEIEEILKARTGLPKSDPLYLSENDVKSMLIE